MIAKVNKSDVINKGSWIIIYNNKRGDKFSFIHVMLGNGKRSLTIGAQNKICKIKCDRASDNLIPSSLVDFYNSEETTLFFNNRCQGKNDREWFYFDKEGIREIDFSE